MTVDSQQMALIILQLIERHIYCQTILWLVCFGFTPHTKSITDSLLQSSLSVVDLMDQPESNRRTHQSSCEPRYTRLGVRAPAQTQHKNSKYVTCLVSEIISSFYRKTTSHTIFAVLKTHKTTVTRKWLSESRIPHDSQERDAC